MIETKEQTPAQTETDSRRRIRAPRRTARDLHFPIYALSAAAVTALVTVGYIYAQPYLDRYLPASVVTVPAVTSGEPLPPPPVTAPAETSASPVETSSPEETRRTRPVFEPGERSDCLLAPTDDAGEEYLNRIVFLGDSRTYGLKTYEMLKNGRQTEQVWVPASGTLQICDAYNAGIQLPDGTEVKLRELVSQKKPEILMGSLGINYVNYAKSVRSDEDDFKFWYRKLLDMLKTESPDTVIVIGGILPVNETVYETYDNKTLTERNDWLLDLAYEYGLYYLNLGEDMVDEYGDLLLKYQNGDGCHPGTAGYTAILNYVRTHAVPEEGSVPGTSEFVPGMQTSSEPAVTVAPPITTSTSPSVTSAAPVSEPAVTAQSTETTATLPQTQSAGQSDPPPAPSSAAEESEPAPETSIPETSAPETTSEAVHRRYQG